jgi:hypothetical protein
MDRDLERAVREQRDAARVERAREKGRLEKKETRVPDPRRSPTDREHHLADHRLEREEQEARRAESDRKNQPGEPESLDTGVGPEIRVCRFELSVGGGGCAMWTYQIVSITLKIPHQIQSLLDREGEAGWSPQGVTTSFLYLGKSGEAKRESRMVSVTLKMPGGIRKEIERHCAEGWELGALGGNFAFFHRAAGAKTTSTETRLESITLRLPGGLLALANRMGAEGWELRDLSPSFAVFQRSNARPKEHALESITLRTPAATQRLLNDKASQGWKLGGVGRSFIALCRDRES